MITPENITYDAVCLAAAQFPLFQDYKPAKFYSQAEHAVILSLYVERLGARRGYSEHVVAQVAKHALLHLTSNFVLDYFEVKPTGESWDLIAYVERRLFVDECRALDLRIARRQDVEPLGATIAFLSWEQAAAAFCSRFCELWPDWDEAARAEVWREGVRALRGAS